MKYFILILFFVLFSCGNKEDILLPKANTSIVKNVGDLSPIYIFFRKKGNDTVAEVNRKNSIISTNWILNVDKRLPLRLAIVEIMKLQQKKREEKAHKNEKAQNYYSYADTIGGNLAFIPFTNTYYKLEKPKSGVVVFFTKENQILVDKVLVKQEELLDYLNKSSKKEFTQYLFCFDKNLNFGSYIQNKIFMNSLKLPFSDFTIKQEEFIF
jgi:biopolymer transport protein ExbD